MSNFERDMANTMLDAADARIASLEADKADLLRVLGVADEKIRSGEDARGQYIRENAALEARCRELEKECDDADFMDARIADLERQLSQYKEAFHKAFNQFENITVSDTLAVVKERAHQMIGWAYAVLPDYALETAVKPSRMCPECHAVGGPDGVTICTTCASGWWEQGCEHCGSLEVNPKCPACNGIERDAP